jgi:hypothetical protein
MNKLFKKIKKYAPLKTKETENSEKDYAKGMNKNITTPQIDIVVKRLQGETPVHIAKFRAIQNRDRTFNLKIINEEFDFKDDLDLTKNIIIDSLNYKLDLVNISDEEKLIKINAEILKQEQTIKEIELKGESNKFAEIGNKNIHDERHRLNCLKVLKHTISNKGRGTFEEINMEGFRQRTYLLQNGTLIPYFHNAEKVTLYPHQAINRKIHRETQDMIDRDFIDENTSKGGLMFNNFLKIAVVILLILNVWWGMENQSTSAELSDMATNSQWAEIMKDSKASALLCAEYLSTQVSTNNDLITYAKDYLLNESKKEKILKDEDDIDI